MNEHYDALETRDPAQREAMLMAVLPAQVRTAQATAGFAPDLADIDAAEIGTRTALARLPVTRKHQLLERQQAARDGTAGDPFGGMSAIGWRGIGAARIARRVFQSPGPIYEPEGHAADYWRLARALFAAGIRAGDLVHNSFSYHLTPAGSMMETGAQALGCVVFPGGVGNTELQLQALRDLGADAYCGTPSFLRILLDKADAEGVALPRLKHALVSGEAFPPSLRDAFANSGVDAFQAYATADVGCIAYETAARQGLVLAENLIVEIVRPGTDDLVPEPESGTAPEVGEVVVTVLNPDYPLLRFGTGDLSALLPGTCPTGRTNHRIRGWLGRADQTAKVRGMFVHPSQVAQVLKRHPEVIRARLVIEGEMANDRMTLHAECAVAPAGLQAALAQSLRDITKLRAEVACHAPGTLANDGRVIEDQRSLA
ncbi:MAG: phenylacetate--CoA ligase family protein [Rubrivivax sp.]